MLSAETVGRNAAHIRRQEEKRGEGERGHFLETDVKIREAQGEKKKNMRN